MKAWNAGYNALSGVTFIQPGGKRIDIVRNVSAPADPSAIGVPAPDETVGGDAAPKGAGKGGFFGEEGAGAGLLNIVGFLPMFVEIGRGGLDNFECNMGIKAACPHPLVWT